MKPARPPLPHVLRLLVLAALLAGPAAHADEYGEITQLLRAGKSADALAKADQALATKPRDPQLRFLRGVAQAETGKPGDAIATFTRLTEEYPELPEPYNNLAVLYANQNQLDKARSALEMAIRTNPSYATAHENLGDVYAKLASQAYNKALQLDDASAATVKPKLALIHELFMRGPAAGKNGSGKPATPAPLPPAAATPAAPSPAAPVAAAVPPAPAPAPAQPPVPAPAAAAQAPAAPPAPAASESADEKDVVAAVQAWAAAWSARDVKTYLSAYAKDFDPPGKQSRSAWESERRLRIEGKSRIAVKLSELRVAVTGAKAVARFRQDYSADTLRVTSRKTLELVKSDGQWAIVKESTGA
ncbi:tetratricopeptide repeat protein [Ramlibacter sp. H39-3-26]|uniref:L,D-transpeptidase Cds6 family protein n=1 Tax=Curvibacter soli TaxID=3031331 RepID=UPI0023DAB4B7|nr:tetratricopeptide repeat protein [Ramlibacter sp. H39-3-26]MDF1485285.1 tetratricopeptide repeat protein [Ramlibacter sp. H39-3-26]